MRQSDQESSPSGRIREKLKLAYYDKIAPDIEAVLAERDTLREALKPFADNRNWTHNYDGTGTIFRCGPYDKDNDLAIGNARAALYRP